MREDPIEVDDSGSYHGTTNETSGEEARGAKIAQEAYAAAPQGRQIMAPESVYESKKENAAKAPTNTKAVNFTEFRELKAEAFEINPAEKSAKINLATSPNNLLDYRKKLVETAAAFNMNSLEFIDFAGGNERAQFSMKRFQKGDSVQTIRARLSGALALPKAGAIHLGGKPAAALVKT